MSLKAMATESGVAPNEDNFAARFRDAVRLSGLSAVCSGCQTTTEKGVSNVRTHRACSGVAPHLSARLSPNPAECFL